MDAIIRFYELLQNQPVLTLFFIIGVGYLIGNVKLGSFSFGPVAGVLFAGLFLGHFGFRMSAGAQSVGFALFIFSVGYQAGPRFFDVLMSDGLRYFLLALVIAVTGFSVAAVMSFFLELQPGTSAGLLAGGLTSSPTLAAAQQVILDGTISPPPGWSPDQVVENITTGYAITYIFGLAGLIAIVKLLPMLLGINLSEEAARLEAADTASRKVEPLDSTIRAYRVTNEAFVKPTLAEFRKQFNDDFSTGALVRNGEVIKLDQDDHLQLGDEIILLGPVSLFTQRIHEVGEEIAPPEGLRKRLQTARIVVTNRDIAGKTLGELDLARTYHVQLNQVRRMRFAAPLTKTYRLRRGDILSVTSTQECIERLGNDLGAIDADVAGTDMLTFSFGIALGVIIGLFSIEIGGVSVGLGSAGGLLSSGLLIGFLRHVRPTFGRLPDAARWILMELGLLIFMAGVGLRAGGGIVETFIQAGPLLVFAGFFVTLTPVLIGYLFGRKVLSINPVLLLGAITGAMTSGASLSIVTSEAKSSFPTLGYTGTYAFANVLLTVAGSIILLMN